MQSTFLQRINIIILFCLACFGAKAQGDAPKYLYEIGGMIGGSFYMGDANKNTVFRNMNPTGGAIFRYNIDFRTAIKANLMWARVTGSTVGLENVFPDNAQASFERNVIDIGGQMEFNFFPYSDEFKYLNTKRVSPYILGGIGLSAAPANGDMFFSPHISIGTGVKYKLKPRINIGAEFSIRKLFGDGLDVSPGNNLLDNPYQMESGWMKNKDWYSMLTIFVTYDFGLRNCNCNRSDMNRLY